MSSNLLFVCGGFNWGLFVCRYLPNIAVLWVLLGYTIRCIVGCVYIFLKFLFYNTLCCFKVLNDICALDFLANRFVRFEINIFLVSFVFCMHLSIGFYVLENNTISTFSNLYENANFFECEIWDMFGVLFVGSKRGVFHIFLDYGFKGYPLRKDFSLFGYNQVKFSYFTVGLFLRTGYVFNCSARTETASWSLIN